MSQLNSSSVQSQLKAAGYTLEKYERSYRQAFYDAAKKADPNWEIGKPIKEGALDNVTRESIEAKKSLAQSTVDTKIWHMDTIAFGHMKEVNMKLEHLQQIPLWQILRGIQWVWDLMCTKEDLQYAD